VLSALARCATNGELDDVHEYHRPSVDFQQILSAAWMGLRQHRPLTRQNLPVRTGGVEPAVLDDMLESGVLDLAGSAILPTNEWCDLGDERKIHSVIVGAPGQPLVDLLSGEVLGHGAANDALGGMIFAGGGLRPVKGGDENGVYLGPQTSSGNRPLARLPSARGRMRGLSRQVVHAIADLKGWDRSRWRKDGDKLLTWGGHAYNVLLRGILLASGYPRAIRAGAFGLDGIGGDVDLRPDRVREIADHIFGSQRFPASVAEKFREGTQFLSSLSPAVQREEARRAVPMDGFMAWLEDCRNAERAGAKQRTDEMQR
jgi:hypothetical protein